MRSTQSHSGVVNIDARVRANCGPAAMIGGLLIVFGFFYLKMPTGADLFDQAETVFCYTVRIGGLIMIGVAVWSSFGHLPAVLTGALTAGLIGASLVVTGVLMFVDGGTPWQPLVNVICGTLLVRSGLRSWQCYRELAPLEVEDDDVDEVGSSAATDGAALADELVQRSACQVERSGRAQSAPADSPDLVEFTPVKRKRASSSDEPIRLDGVSSGSAKAPRSKRASPPPDGHLADFAKKDRPSKT